MESKIWGGSGNIGHARRALEQVGDCMYLSAMLGRILLHVVIQIGLANQGIVNAIGV